MNQEPKNQKEKKDNDRKLLALFLLFLKNPKNLPLIASLVGGAAVVTTGAILLAPPLESSSQPSSLVSSSEDSSSITSSVTSSASSTSSTSSDSSEPLPMYTVTFDARGGTDVDAQSIEQGNLVLEPSSSYALMTLEGWYTSSDEGQTLDLKWNFAEDTVEGNITLYAAWDLPMLVEYDILSAVDSSVHYVDEEGVVWAWGEDNNGSLGIGNREKRPYPTRVNLSNLAPDEVVIHLSASYSHTLYYTNLGNVYATGNNSSSQFGISSQTLPSYAIPTLLTIELNDDETFLAAWAGYGTSWLLTSMGRLLVAGENYDGEAGIPVDGNEEIAPFQEVSFPTFSDDEKVVNFGLGDYGYFAVSNLGNAYGWGYDDSRLGLGLQNGDTVASPALISFPGLALGEYPTLIQSFNYTAIAMTNQGSLYGWGDTSNGQLLPPEFDLDYYYAPVKLDVSFFDNNPIVSLRFGSGHLALWTEDGSLYQVGDNDGGQFGVNAEGTGRFNTPVLLDTTPLEAGESILAYDPGNDATFLVTTQGRVFGVGDNGSNVISVKNTSDFIEITEIISYSLQPDDYFIQIAMGSSFMMGLTFDGLLYGWGSNTVGQLARSIEEVEISFAPLQIGLDLLPGEHITRIEALTDTAYVLTSEGRLLGWGYNEYAALGVITDDIHVRTPLVLSYPQLQVNETIVALFPETSNMYILTDQGNMYAWGLDYQTLGLGLLNDFVYVPTLLEFEFLPGESIEEVFPASGKMFVKTSNDHFFVWGNNNQYALSLPVAQYQLFPELVSFNDLNSGESIVSIISDNNVTMALTSQSRIIGWGYNINDQLATGEDALKLAIDTPLIYTPLGLDSLEEGETIERMESNGNGTIYLITSFQRVYVSGNNGNGQLGIGDATMSYYGSFILNTFLTLNQGEAIHMMSFSSSSSSLLTSEGRLFTWGLNSFTGKLGTFSTTFQYRQPQLIQF